MRLLPLPLLIALLPLPLPLAAQPAAQAPAASIPGAQVGDRITPASATKGIIYTARFVDEDTVLVGLDGHLRRIDLDDPKAGWQVPVTYRTRVILPLPGPAGQVLTGADDGVVRVFALDDGRLVGTLKGPPLGWISGVAASPDGRDIVAVAMDGRVNRWRDRRPVEGPWRRPSKVAAPPSPTPPDAPPDPPPGGPFGRLEAAVFSPEGLLVLAGNGERDMALAVFDKATLSQQAHHGGPRSGAVHDHFQYGQALAFSPDGRHLAIGYWGGGLELVSWPDLQTRWASELDDSWISNIRWVGNDRLWAVGAKTLFVVRAEDGAAALQRSTAPNHVFDAFDLSPSRRRAVIGPRATGVVLDFRTDEIGDWAPPRFTRAKAPVAVPPALAPGADPCLGVRCPAGSSCLNGDCAPLD